MNKAQGLKTLGRIALLVLLVVAAAASAQAETGRCVTAEVPSDVVLPDGSTHSAGRIELCMKQRFSPVAGLHTTHLADGFTSMFLSHRSRSEGLLPNAEPYIQFVRASGGQLILDAYAVPDGHNKMWLYVVKPIRKNKAKRQRTPELAFALEDRNDIDEKQVVLLAAAAY
jgi:hypothetical protein